MPEPWKDMDTYLIDLPSSPALRRYYTSMGYVLIITAENHRMMEAELSAIEDRIATEEADE